MTDDPTTRRRGRFDRFLARPASLLVASLAIICVTAATVLVGALVIYLYDDSEFATYGEALWFTLQTATTVGYGDIAPKRAVGRIVAGGVMLVSLALLTVMTATITSYFPSVRRASAFNRGTTRSRSPLRASRPPSTPSMSNSIT